MVGRLIKTFGPPGTGKTTHMATTAIPDAIEEVGPDKIIVTSFTRAAAQEIASKRSIKTGELISVNPQNVGTLHSLCYRALGEPVIAESCKKEWNEYAPKYQMTTSVKGDLDEGGELEGPGGSEGEQFLNQANILRAKMTPQEIWPANVLSFYKKWQEFKAERNCMDFTDLIETCIEEALYAPGNPRMMFVDEAQDFTPLQHKLVRSWGEDMDSVMLVGDDDQCQPAGEMVMTTKGYKSIESLDPSVDRLCEYDYSSGRMTGIHTIGSGFEIASRKYTGKLYTIFAGGRQTTATINHLWVVKRKGAINFTRSAWLDKDLAVPIRSNRFTLPIWENIDEVRIEEVKDVTVYSLNTPQYHTYIVNDIVTHNCIYRFSGADPKAFLFPDVAAKDKHILNQSYRLPRAIHNKALQIVKNINVREPKEYYPRNFEGAVTYHPDTWKNPESAVGQALEYIKQDKSVMFLATCSYMLEPLKAILRDRYIPYCNPYRKKRGDWNPLLSGGRSKTTSRDLVFDFVSHGPDGNYWTVQQMLSWIKYLKVGEYGLLRKVGKAGIKALEIAVAERSEGLHTTRNVLGQLLTEEATEQALKRNFEWLTDNITGTKREVLEYPIGVYKQHGAESIAEDPKIIIGTIHSVKGGEGSVVFLFPDISYNAMVDFQSSLDAKDSIYRLMYVGATRAKEILHIMSPVSMGRGPACAIAI